MVRKFLLFAALLSVAACKVEVAVPEGGAVTTEQGSYRIEENQSRIIEVNDLAFHETFIADPAQGYLFAGWKKQKRGLCGGSLAACELYTSWMANDESLLAILDSDESFNLTPQFLASDQIRRYRQGDWVGFSGSMVERREFEGEVSTEISGRIDVLSATETLAGKDVLVIRFSVYDSQGEELMSHDVHFWQDSSGAFSNLTDEYGNFYQDTAANERGLQSIPAPLVPFESFELQFNTIAGGPVATPVTEGARTVDVGEPQVISIPLASLSAYPVTILDSWSYLTSFGEFKREQVIEREQIHWVSQVKGIVKSSIVQRRYSSIGKLQMITTLELVATDSSF